MHAIPGAAGFFITDDGVVSTSAGPLAPNVIDGRVGIFIDGKITRRHPDDLLFAATGVNRDDWPGEQWRAVVGFALYEVSNLGRVRSWVFRGKRRLRPKVLKAGGRKYPTVALYTEGGTADKHDRTVHRLVLEAFVGPCPPGKECLHRNDVKTDNRMANLRWGTRKENSADARRNNCRRRKLTDGDYAEIKRLWNEGTTGPELGRLFGVTAQYAWWVATKRKS